jgi:universal stress protein A
MIDLKRILVGVDFSKHSENAVRYAVAFAEALGAELHLLHVVPGPVAYTRMYVPPEDWLVEERDAARRELERLPGVQAQANVSVLREVRSGSPLVEIVQYAREANIDLIVMGTHGRSGLAHLLLGSVAENVVRQAPCPVLTVRDPEHEFIMP